MAHSEHAYKQPVSSNYDVWEVEEYEAGYQARFLDVAACMTATACWRAGWEEAHREISAGAPMATEQPIEDMAKWSVFGTGRQARACGLPFDATGTEAWKQSWVAADIRMGLAERHRSFRRGNGACAAEVHRDFVPT